MVDRVSEAVRSYNMRRIGSRDTKPELEVRRFLHSRGFRYRLHRRDLPGKPDLVLARYRTVVQVFGCFWHQHPDANCVDSHVPKSNGNYWGPKLAATVSRDRRSIAQLESLGWAVEVLWECEITTHALGSLVTRLRRRGDPAV